MADAERINPGIIDRFAALKAHRQVRGSHHLHGRFENSYVAAADIPELQPVIDSAQDLAAQILGRTTLRSGFWLNEMAPGHRTSLHHHDEDDELLSAVYYVSAHQHSGRLILRSPPMVQYLDPEPGLFVFFPPDVLHEVEVNASQTVRLSVAFNFGPAPTG